jgi:class 3 adenylate cyclase
MIKDGHSVESELRQATVLFADISGFTAMSEKMLPEEVTAIMNQCFKMMGECIDFNGGRIDKFIGDCIMVVFGVPDTIEKAPQKAINTAIEIRNSLYRFNKEKNLAIPLDVHIGINSGIVLAGMVGADQKQEYTVMGDTVNLASRLEDASDRGQILVGPLTYRVTRQNFEYKTLPPILLKGKADPVPVYEVLSIKINGEHIESDKNQKSMLELSISSELVGRENEMNRLRLMLHKVINREGGIVTITAEAGIGKSRLMAELMNDPAMKQIMLLEGKAISIGQNLSYHPIIDLFKKWAGIRDDDNERESLQKFEKAVRSIHPEEADEIIQFVGTLMRLNLPDKYNARLRGIESEAMGKIISKNIREIFGIESELHPLIIYIEDLHWADSSTIDLLISLLRLVEKHRILFIFLFRPGYEITGEQLLEELNQNFSSFHTSIVLEPLDESESALLIDNLLNIRGFPPALKDQISSRTGGNPYFIEEVIRSFIDREAVILRNGSFEVTEKINKVEVPLTINEVIMSRLDRLDRETKDLIKIASVIGRNFFQKIIIYVAHGISEIDKRLNYLENTQFIREHIRMDELEYLFKHALVQEAAYGSLLIQKRKEIHLQVAQAIETVFNERLHEFYGMLAYHYNMGDDLDKTEEYLIKAGEESLKVSASNEAIYYYKQALGLYQRKYGNKADPRKIAILEKNIGIAMSNKGHYSESIEYLDRALTFYRVRIPQHPVTIFIKTFIDFFIFIIGVYFPSLMWKAQPRQYDNEINSLLFKKIETLAQIEPKEFFIHNIYYLRRLTKFDLMKIKDENGMDIGATAIALCSTAFTWTGLSYSVGRKMLDFVQDKIDMNNTKSALSYKFARLMLNYMSGDRSCEIDYDKDLINYNIIKGEFARVIAYCHLYANFCIEIGDFTEIGSISNKLSTLYNEYGNIYANIVKFIIRTRFLMKTRKLEEGVNEAKEGIKFSNNKKEFDSWVFLLFSLKSIIQIFMGDTDAAAVSLQKAEAIKYELQITSVPFGRYMLGRFNLNLRLLEDALKRTDRSLIKHLLTDAISTGKKVLKISNKFANIRTETFLLMGLYCWLSDKPGKSLKWWLKAIEAGKQFNERLELSRVYFEIGRRLLEKPVTPRNAVIVRKTVSLMKKKTGLTPEECLNRAERMFKEMDLQWDLEQLEMIKKLNLIKTVK